jgi:hypothetical protein
MRMTHLTRADNRAPILRNGIRRSRDYGGVFAMPILPDYYASHQWLRELRRPGSRGARTPLIAVDFVIPDDEPVLVGHYSDDHIEMPATEAAAAIMAAKDPRGYEIIVPRSISPGEIKGTRSVRQVVGWRYQPDAHSRGFCACPVCIPRGSYKRRQMLERERR